MPLKTETYLTTLTPLRGIAALLVVIFHSNLMFMQFMPPGYTEFINSGWLWVDFFFVLSGFIMSYVYKDFFSKRVSWSNYKKFIGARFSRVYPLYFFTTIWALIAVIIIVNKASGLDPFFAAIFNPNAAVPCLLLIQSIHLYITPPLNTPAWSLSTEWWVYVIFPFIFPLFSNLKVVGKTVALIFIVAFFLWLRYVIGPIDAPFPHSPPSLNIIAHFGILRCQAGFLTGMLLYDFYRVRAGYAFFKRSWAFIFFLVGTFVCMHFGIMDIIIIGLFPFIILTAAYNNTRIKKLLDTRILQRLGDWSFSIYMVHVPIIWTFTIKAIYKQPDLFADFSKLIAQKPNYLLGAIVCAVIVALTIFIASLTYRFIEVPARNYLNSAFKTKAKKVNAVSLEV